MGQAQIKPRLLDGAALGLLLTEAAVLGSSWRLLPVLFRMREGATHSRTEFVAVCALLNLFVVLKARGALRITGIGLLGVLCERMIAQNVDPEPALILGFAILSGAAAVASIGLYVRQRKG